MSETQANGRTIFLTGATGFLGKVVLEELIRRRYELQIEKVIVLIRPSKTSPHEAIAEESHLSSRFHDEVVTSKCFAQLSPGWTRYVEPVYGDLGQAHCGLDTTAYEKISRETTHIIHCAACVQFDLPLSSSLDINLQGTLNILQLARTCSSLERFVYTSTAYVTPHGMHDQIREELAPLGPWQDAQELLDALHSGSVTEGELLQQTCHPNTYTLSKCITEHFVLHNRGEIPITIVRPSIITAALERPCPGWSDSASAVVGVVLGVQDGGVCALGGDPTAFMDLVPVDYVADFIIDEVFAVQASSAAVPIVHCVSGLRSITPKILSSVGAAYFQQSEMRWLNYRSSPTTHLYRYVWQMMPLKLARTFCWVGGDHRAVRQLARATQNIDKLDHTFGYFLSNSFNFAASRPTLAQRAPYFKPAAYMQMIFRGAQQFMMRRTRERNMVSTEKLIAGEDVNNGGENALKLFLTSRASVIFRFTAVVVGAALNRMFQRVTFDQRSFFDALEGYNSGLSDEKIIIMPTHRSYMDFVICPYLFYQFPVLGVKIPCIAAQEQFSRVPVLGWLLRRLGAFFVRRGIGRADPELNEQVRQLVEQDEHILFFPEGQRSRSREFLSPRRGLLRSLQGTGKSFKILPVSISYERVPEEGAFIRETQEQERPRMSLFALIRWTYSMILGRVRLGRVHVKCGRMLELNPETDVHAISDQVLNELQENTVVTTYHLESFVNYHRRDCRCSPPCAISGAKRHSDAVNWLRKQLEERGATVLDGALSVDVNQHSSPALETSLMNQWMHFFDRDSVAMPPSSAVAAVDYKVFEVSKCQSVIA
ncbi:uncharacterized protein Triagg1_3561 [Trichoderma aggressivum f. europaeum]|uniref:Fatty acyl-CoA reductase n=1 Tax=Trichoderma aggressivum f. europaeum TaxID=173218 RepID=A0AAE1M0E7_9HYPO|nr:hypothetical protein Triagg1_3561 [Trichoderma aggressivum f. europaeum]